MAPAGANEPEYRDATARQNVPKSAGSRGAVRGAAPPLAQRGACTIVRSTRALCAVALRTILSVAAQS